MANFICGFGLAIAVFLLGTEWMYGIVPRKEFYIIFLSGFLIGCCGWYAWIEIVDTYLNKTENKSW